MRHGGDLLSYKNCCEGKIIDFSSNINPLGPPKGLKKELFQNYENVVMYPDIEYRKLKREISRYLGCQEDEVIVGNGAVEIIDNMCKMFKRVVVSTPCFSEYIERAEVNGKKVIRVPMQEDFNINKEKLTETISQGDLIILGNPNNPTGKRIGMNDLFSIYELVNDKNAFLLLDEAFFEFCPKDYDSIELFGGRENVCIIRAATKFFALPGIRLGYACTNKDVVKRYNKYSLPWSVNSFGEIAGREIFRDKEYIEKSKLYMEEQRQFLLKELNRFKFLRIYESQCNFILLKLLGIEEEKLFNFLIGRGILVRRASSFEELDNSFIRVAVKDLKSNRKLLKGLKEFEKWKQ